MLTVIFSPSLHLTQNVKAQTDPTAPHWITEEWINPNYQTGLPVQNTHPFKIILDCLDTDNSCVNNIPSGQGLKSITVFAGPSPRMFLFSR